MEQKFHGDSWRGHEASSEGGKPLPRGRFWTRFVDGKGRCRCIQARHSSPVAKYRSLAISRRRMRRRKLRLRGFGPSPSRIDPQLLYLILATIGRIS